MLIFMANSSQPFKKKSLAAAKKARDDCTTLLGACLYWFIKIDEVRQTLKHGAIWEPY